MPIPETEEAHKSPVKKSLWRRVWPTLLTLTIIALLVALAISSLPRIIPSDFSVVGKGNNAVVLVYDPNVLRSTEITSAMNAIRDDYKGDIEFLVAQLGSPTGRELSAAFGLDTVALIFFDGNGKVLQILHSSQDAASLRHNVTLIFKLEDETPLKH